MKKVYISGPISYMENENEDSFRTFENILKEYGIESVVPHDLFNAEEKRTFTQDQFLCRCIEHEMKCDAVLTIADWEHSEGAVKEVQVARLVNKPIIYFIKLKPWLKSLGISEPIHY